MKKIQFEVRNDERLETRPYGVFVRDYDDDSALEKIKESVDASRMNIEEAIAPLRSLAGKHPHNLELHSYLAYLLWQIELKDDATDIYERLFKIAKDAIPKTFDGLINYYELSNRPFFRIAHGYLLGLMYQRRAREARMLARQLLRWWPNDNMGVRVLMPDILLMLGEHKAALKRYLANAEHYPTCWYPCALIAYRTNDLVKACTYLRRGILENLYVAEALTGRTLLKKHLYWHGSGEEGCESAVDYMNSNGNDWSETELDFVDWVFNSPQVLHERAELMTCNVALTKLSDPNERGHWLERRVTLLRSVGDQLSMEIVAPIPNWYGVEILPWDRAGQRRMPGETARTMEGAKHIH